MFDPTYAVDTRAALFDYVQARAGQAPADMHPIATSWRKDWIPFLTAAHRAGFLDEPTPASLYRSLGYSDLGGLVLTAAAASVQGDVSPGLIEHRQCCGTQDLGDYKATELGEIILPDVPAQSDTFSPVAAPVADLSNFVSGKVSRYILRQLISRHLLVNGNLDVVAQIIAAARAGLLRSEGKAFAALLESNSGDGPVLGDGDNLFTTANAITGGLDTTGLNAASAAMRAMSVADTYNGARPGILLVPAEDEFSAAVLVDATGNRLKLAVSPWLASGSYYCFARPGEQAAVIRLRLDGADEPRTEQMRSPPDRDALAVQSEHCFGFVAVSRLGVVKVTATP
jgi:hypothetical protein